MTIVDTPGLVDPGVANSVIDNDVYQWFIDRSDVIYIVIDVTQLQLSTGLKLLIEQLKGKHQISFKLTQACPALSCPFRQAETCVFYSAKQIWFRNNRMWWPSLANSCGCCPQSCLRKDHHKCSLSPVSLTSSQCTVTATT